MYARHFTSILGERLAERSPLIQILLGPRQVGKTTGVNQFLASYDGPSHYCSADAMVFAGETWLLEQWQAAAALGEGALLVVDEIPKVPRWPDVVKKLWDEQQRRRHRVKVVLLGSSALALQRGMTESLAGRFELIRVFHWDYAESRALRRMSLETYLTKGGYPKSYDFLQDDDRWTAYLRDSVVNPVIDKDILQFAVVKNPSLFRQAFEILCCYPAQEISYRKLLGQLQDKGNVDLIKSYIALFEGALLLKSLGKYGRQDFQVKSSSPKIVLLAPCLYTLFATNREKAPFVFESSVGAKLLQLPGELYYWRDGNDEVDFVLKWRKRLFAIEVKSGRKKSVTGLNAFCERFPDAFPVIVTPENYAALVADPTAFLTLASGG